MELEQEVRRLKLWNRVLVLGFLCILLPWMGRAILQNVNDYMRELKYSRNGNILHVSAIRDGPYVVTHVAASGYGSGDKRWASLREPLLIVDSTGANINLANLKWHDYKGEPADAPSASEELNLMYFEPLLAGPRK